MMITRIPGPIKPLIEIVYLREILFLCEYVGEADERISLLEENQPLEMFRELSALLQHAAAVSRILWPAPKGSPEQKERARRRGEHLRAKLHITDDHPLSKRGQARTLRNDFEHFDERLDEWAESSAGKCLIDLKIAPRTALPNVADGDILRWFDRISGTLYFRGTPFEIRSIVEAVKDVEARAKNRREFIEASEGKPRLISSTGLVIEG